MIPATFLPEAVRSFRFSLFTPIFLRYIRYLIRAEPPAMVQTIPTDHQMPQTPIAGIATRITGTIKRPATSVMPFIRAKVASPTPFRTPRTT